MDTADKKKTRQFSGFLDTLYPDKPFIQRNPSMWQHRKQTMPRLWSCDSGLLLIIKQNVAAAVVWCYSEARPGRDITPKQNIFPALPSCRCVPGSPENIGRRNKREIVGIKFSIMQSCVGVIHCCWIYVHTLHVFVLNLENINITFFTRCLMMSTREMLNVGLKASLFGAFAAAEKTDLQEAAFEIDASLRLMLWSPRRIGIQFSFSFIAATYDVRGMKRIWRVPPVRQWDTAQADRQASTTTDLWSWLWSRESRFPLSWRRGRCTVLQPARSLHAEIGVHPGKYNVTDKLRRRCMMTDSAVSQWKPDDVLTRAERLIWPVISFY